MKEVHHNALKEIEVRFGTLERVDEEGTSLQVGWTVNLGDEKVSFNFIADGIRIFAMKKLSSKSKYKGLELLRQCSKKAGLEQLVYYTLDETTESGNRTKTFIPGCKDGLDDIAEYYKIHAIEALDATGGGYHRIGSFKR